MNTNHASNRVLYRPASTPAGKELFAYFGALLEVTGMMNGETFPVKKFFSNLSTHISAGRIQLVSQGNYKLSPQGKDYFLDRFNQGNRQYIERGHVDSYKQKIINGASDWIKVDV